MIDWLSLHRANTSHPKRDASPREQVKDKYMSEIGAGRASLLKRLYPPARHKLTAVTLVPPPVPPRTLYKNAPTHTTQHGRALHRIPPPSRPLTTESISTPGSPARRFRFPYLRCQHQRYHQWTVNIGIKKQKRETRLPAPAYIGARLQVDDGEHGGHRRGHPRELLGVRVQHVPALQVQHEGAAQPEHALVVLPPQSKVKRTYMLCGS